MLVMSATPRAENRRRLAAAAWRMEVPIKLAIRVGRLELMSLPWREYWAPCLPFLSADYPLTQRLNRLKAAWLAVHRASRTRRSVAQYVWRYFGLLHHVWEIARREPHRRDRRNPNIRQTGSAPLGPCHIGSSIYRSQVPDTQPVVLSSSRKCGAARELRDSHARRSPLAQPVLSVWVEGGSGMLRMM